MGDARPYPFTPGGVEGVQGQPSLAGRHRGVLRWGCGGVRQGKGGCSVSVTQAPRGTASLRARHRHGNRQAISDNCVRWPGNGAK